ncbi:MAG: hypothetical protein QW291_05605 [Thermofilaceae archaeon]
MPGDSIDIINVLLNELRKIGVEYLTTVIFVLPRILGMALILIAGWLLGRLTGKLIAAFVKISKADDALHGTPLGVYLNKAGYSLSSLLDLVTRASVYILTIALALRVLQVPEATSAADALLQLVGRLILGAIILTIGLFVVEKVIGVVSRVLEGNHETSIALGVTHAILLAIIIAAAASSVGVDLSPIVVVLSSVAWGVGAGIGFAIVLVTLALLREELSYLFKAFIMALRYQSREPNKQSSNDSG